MIMADMFFAYWLMQMILMMLMKMMIMMMMLVIIMVMDDNTLPYHLTIIMTRIVMNMMITG